MLEVGLDRVPDELKDALRKWVSATRRATVNMICLAASRANSIGAACCGGTSASSSKSARPLAAPPVGSPTWSASCQGNAAKAERPRVMAVIDTSGSITPELLESISAELALLARHHAVLVVECDAMVHAVYEYLGPLRAVHGRGGTDFRPPLVRNFLRKHRPDLVVYFTDGFGPAPEQGPQVPLAWCLVPGGSDRRARDG